jgi:serine-type D-Ala-D-Ala carboxypeptidase/endopeptidase (penicillin-binding protein 4)
MTVDRPERRSADPRIRRAVGVFGLASALVAATAFALDPVASARPVPASAGPLMSVRRAPTVLRVALGRQNLAKALELVMSDSEFAPARSSSCVHVVVDGGTVYDDGAGRPVTPASTLKVLTTAAALSVIPAGATFTTEVRAAAPPSGGVVGGDLWLVGGGDPLLETADYTATQDHRPEIATKLEDLADKVVAAGVTRIDGRVIGDDRRYDDMRVLPTWKRGYLASGEVGPIGALSINDNFTVKNAKGRRTGSPNPPRDGAAEFAGLLAERGVKISGEPTGTGGGADGVSTAAPETVVASIESVPIELVIQETLVFSDNTAAELLLKEVGFRSTKSPGSFASGAAAVRAMVADRSADPVATVDGSGLDRSDKVTCTVLTDVLGAEPAGGALETGLPVMGRTGTLRKRLKGDPAEGRVRAKTGSLNGVSSLAGFADTRSGARAVFAFVGNSLASTATGIRLGNRIAQQIVSFPDAPDESTLGLS